MTIEPPNQVWRSDITCIPMPRGFTYLTVIMDWASRAVLSWQLSNTLDADLDALEAAREAAGTWPEIMNTDQGCQYTGLDWTTTLRDAGVKISMDGKGRWIDNVMVERLWRSLKYEDVYLRDYGDLHEPDRVASHAGSIITTRSGLTGRSTGRPRWRHGARRQSPPPPDADQWPRVAASAYAPTRAPYFL